MSDNSLDTSVAPASGSSHAGRLAPAIVAILSTAISGYCFAVLPVLRGALQAHLHTSLSQFGFLLSAGAVPGAVSALVGGMLVARTGARSVLRVALVGTAVGYFAAAAVRGWIGMLLAVLLIFLFQGCLALATQAYLADLFPGARRRVLSAYLVTVSVMGIGFPLWAEAIVRMQADPTPVSFRQLLHVPFAVVGAPMLLGAVLLRQREPRAQRRSGTARSSTWRRRSLQPGSPVLVALLVLHVISDNAAYLWMSRVLASPSFPASLVTPGVVMASFSLGYAVSRAFLSMLPEQVGRNLLLVAPGLLGGTAFIAGVLSHQQVLTAAGYVLGGFLWSLEYPALLATLSRREGRNFGFALGLVTVGSGIGSFVVPYGMGLAGSALGDARLWTILLWPAVGFLAVGAGGAFWLARYRPFATAERDGTSAAASDASASR